MFQDGGPTDRFVTISQHNKPLTTGGAASSSNMFEFLRTNTLYKFKHALTVKGHVYKQGDFTIRIGSLLVGSVQTGQPYAKLFLV